MMRAVLALTVLLCASMDAGKAFTPRPMPAIAPEPEDAVEEAEMSLEEENAALKDLEEKRMVEEAEAEEGAEE